VGGGHLSRADSSMMAAALAAAAPTALEQAAATAGAASGEPSPSPQPSPSPETSPGLAVSDDVPQSLKPGDRVAYTPLNGEQQLGVVINVQNSASPSVLVAFDRFVWSTFKHSDLARFTCITTAFDADVVREVIREQSGGKACIAILVGPCRFLATPPGRSSSTIQWATSS